MPKLVQSEGWLLGKGLLILTLSGCFSKDQVYLDGIVRILRHRQTIDFPLLTSLGKVRGQQACRGPASFSFLPVPLSHRGLQTRPLRW